jgi:hypothetical protein
MSTRRSFPRSGLFAVALAAASWAQAPSSPKKAEPTRPSEEKAAAIDMAPEPEGTPKGVRAAHLAYGLGRAEALAKRAGTVKNDSGDDFAIELAGRRLELATWRKLPEGGTDDELERWSAADSAGFLPEAVILGFAKPGWTVPGDGLSALRVAKFRPWAEAHLFGHPLHATAATTPGNGKRFPEVPGKDLLDFSSLPVGQLEICAAHARLDGAVTRWRAQAENLDGVPLVAEDPKDFLVALELVKSDPAFAKRGATWVDPSVGRVHYLAGFCANEREDWAAAQRALSTAIVLMPGHTSSRLELAHAYLAQKKPEPAVELLQSALRLATDPCDLARLWRKLGYARFDQGRFVEATEAYETSLRYEPDNPLAKKELRLLRDAMMKHGVTDTKTAGTFPAAPQITSRCQAHGGE